MRTPCLRALWSLSILLYATASLVAQSPSAQPTPTQFDIDATGMTPNAITGPVFTNDETLTVHAQGEVHVFTGLPATPQHLTLAPSGGQAMGSPWYRLDDTTAAYRSVGANLQPGDNDDELILITGLPDAPMLRPTGLFERSPDWLLLEPGAAVQLDAASDLLRVLRWDNAGATETPVPFGFTVSDLGVARISPDRIIVLAPGADGQPSTTDDEFVTVDGLQTLSPVIGTTPVPTSCAPLGITATRQGTATTWQRLGLDQVLLHIIDASGPSLVFNPFVSNPGVQFAPFFVPAVKVKGLDDAFHVTMEDDAPGLAHALLTQVGSAPSQVGAWHDDWNLGCWSEMMDENEVVGSCPSVGNAFKLDRYQVGQYDTVTIPGLPSNSVVYPAKMHSQLVAAMSYSQFEPVGQSARLTLVSDLWGTNSVQTINGAGQWAGDGFDLEGNYWPVRAHRLGSGRIASFVDLNLDGSIDKLRMVSLPGVFRHGDGIAGGGLELVSLDLSYAVGNAVVGFDAFCPATWAGPGFLAISTEATAAAPLPSALFATGSQTFLDFSQLLPLATMPGAGGQLQVVFDFSVHLPGIAGKTAYMQAIVPDNTGTLHVSAVLRSVLF